ncbi:MAG: N-acetylglucosamine-6-phosphate deacetylase [Mastigocoleus sp. MO_167.B18]|uniref:N-acetylglucosamine-6-phosphate deacetylase n=1 Tax=Mastigocoleus sp. MO_188.B34 TaxID=3036635 RepID=UPI002639D74F|nr:N-acetylglucosamine-6-phosphate deacetylase [Mastigocoleus sp. MO_188.B34]MDJ0697587.1 N-acetylglucosamine-6-phosphate deacetylase [Mastigocoleus sp. MO_188.B34]MDJ0774072.1 N-acetylglucosamine-6-phosphate deacetylase [Mastigocoleus sp. MO_167.B18]
MIKNQDNLNFIPKPFNIINARLPGSKDLHMLFINREGKVDQILPMDAILKRGPISGLQILDFGGDWVSLGGVDLQINGALGLAFPDLSPENADILPKISHFLWNMGIDAFLPTLVTTSIENIHRSLAAIANEKEKTESSAKIIGVHLEGPFLNPEKRGAHPEEYLLPLTLEEVKRILGDYTNLVKIITIAPELDTTGEVIPYLCSQGITVSLGHSQATEVQARKAFEQGATMVTHAFNAMPPLHHREPGLLGAALLNEGVMCGLIADGKHVCPTMINILLRASKFAGGIFLVSDALAPLGLPDGTYPWDSREIVVKDGTARLHNGTLSGTTLPLLVGAQNLVKWGICNVETAIDLVTEAPRKAIYLPGLNDNTTAKELIRWHFDEKSKELYWKRLE